MSTNWPIPPRSPSSDRRGQAGPRTLHQRLLPAAIGLLTAAGVLLTAGCASTASQLAREEAQQTAEWNRARAADLTAPVLDLTWPEALARLPRGNPKLLAVGLEVVRAREDLRQTQRSLLPILNFQAGYNRALSNSANTGFDPFTFAANVFVDMPGLVTYRARLVGSELGLQRALLARDLVVREQTIELYRAFATAARLEDEEAHNAARLRLAQELAANPGLAGTLERAGRESADLLARSRNQANAAAGDLIGLPGARLRLLPAGLPPAGYDTPATRPAATGLARLQLRLAAVELVGLRARALGVDLQNWPDLSLYLSSPGLYRYGAGTSTYWSTNEVFAGGNTNWTLDTRGRNAGDRRILESETAVRRAALTAEESRNAGRLRTALEALAALDRDGAQLDAAEHALTASAVSPPARAPLAAALHARRDRLETERLDRALEVWFFDDARWPASEDRT